MLSQASEESSIRSAQKQALFRAYNPSSGDWQTTLLSRGESAIHQALKYLAVQDAKLAASAESGDAKASGPVSRVTGPASHYPYQPGLLRAPSRPLEPLEMEAWKAKAAVVIVSVHQLALLTMFSNVGHPQTPVRLLLPLPSRQRPSAQRPQHRQRMAVPEVS